MREDLPQVPDRELLELTDEQRARPALEAFGDALWREALDWLYSEALRRPMTPHPYPDSRREFFGPSGDPQPAPIEGEPADRVLQEFRERVGPLTFNSQHPGSFSYFTPPPLIMSIGGEVLSQWLQQGVDVWHAGPVGAFVEEEVVSWLRDLVGMPEGSWGVLTSGGVMANLMALALARDIRLKEMRRLDSAPRGSELANVRVYASDQTHFSVARGLDVLGFPSDTLRVIASDESFSLRPADVAAAIEEDLGRGLTPLAVSAVAGSTNTGSIDDVPGLGAVARTHGMWFHVDAAYGGAARLSRRESSKVPGLGLADSVTVDPHKWFFQAYDIGGLVVRRSEDLLTTFHRAPEYYRSARPQDEPLNWYQYSIEGTRRFRALKLWMSWKHLGTNGLGGLIEHNVDLARYLADRVKEAPDFELAVEPALSVVCFRHIPGDDRDLDAHQTEMQRALEADGTAWVSLTTLRGRTYLRAGVVNYLSTKTHVDAMLEALRRLADRPL